MKYVLLLLTILPVLTFAGWSTTSGKVTDIYSHDGSVLIKTEVTDGPCGAGGAFWWSTSDDDSPIMLSLALTSFSMGGKVHVVYNPETPSCTGGGAFAKITHLRILSE